MAVVCASIQGVWTRLSGTAEKPSASESPPAAVDGRAGPPRARCQAIQAAARSQAAVSKALVIFGMFMPKLGLVPFLGTTFAAGLAAALAGATSVARSHDPFSWERATEKNRST